MIRTSLRVPVAVLAGASLVLAGGVAAAASGLRHRPAAAKAPVAAVEAQAPAPVLPAPPVERAARSRPAPDVAPLRAVLVPDVVVTTTRPLTAAQAAAVRGIRGVTGSTVLLRGTTRVGTRSVRTLGVDPSTFRPFTPRETARSDALWAAVARGDLAPAYGARLPLGRTLPVAGRISTTARVGAVAAYGLPGVELVVSTELGRQLGLQPLGVVVAAPERGVKGLKRDLRRVLGADVDLEVLRPAAVVHRRPSTYRELYQLSATYCPGLSWTVLAAIGQIESGHGRNVGPSSAGALGPMQFLPSTWAFAGVDGDGDGKADIMNPYDAVPAAALYLCRNGAGRGGQDLYNAVFSYNHADWYVREVLDLAARYR